MKILFLLNSEISREQRIGKEIQALANAGHEIVLLELPPQDHVGPHGDAPCEVQSIDIWTRKLPRNLLFWPFKFIEMTLRFLIIGSRFKLDLIHCVDRMPLLAAFLLACKHKMPYVYYSQEIHSEVNSSANRPRWLWLRLERFLAYRACRVLVTDHFRLDLTAEILQLEKSRMHVLMSLPRIPTPHTVVRPLRMDCPWPDAKIAVYAGGISPQRHLEDIIAALVFLPPNYVIAIVGFGSEDYKSSLGSLAAQLGVSDRMIILPAVKWSDLPAYIKSADCAFAFYEKNSLNNFYCSPSKLFDALMAGLPVVGSDNPLIVEVLHENDLGACVAEVSPRSIADAVESILSRSDLSDMKARAATLARTKYSWNQYESDFVRFYGQIKDDKTKVRIA